MSSDKLPERTMSAPKGDKASLQMWATDAVSQHTFRVPESLEVTTIMF